MAFRLIDLENWERREFYEHFIKEVVMSSQPGHGGLMLFLISVTGCQVLKKIFFMVYYVDVFLF